MAMISGLRLLFPLWCLRHHLSPKGKHVTGFSVAYGSLRIQFLCHPAKAGAQQPVLYLEPLMNTNVRGALLSHRLRGEGGGASHQRRCRRQAAFILAPQGAHLHPAGSS